MHLQMRRVVGGGGLFLLIFYQRNKEMSRGNNPFFLVKINEKGGE